MASAIRESSPPEAVSATGPKGRPAFGRTRKTTSSAPVAPGSSRSCELAHELALPHPDAAKLGRDRVGERGRRGVPLGAELECQRVHARLRLGELPRGDLGRVGTVLESRELCPRLLAPHEQLLVRLAAEAALRLRDPVELGLELFEPARFRLERRQEGVEIRGGLAQAKLGVPQLVAGALQLGREPLERRDRPLRERDEPGRSLAFVGSKGGRGFSRP